MNGKMKLMDSDSEESIPEKLGYNKGYAERYDNWRRLEEQQKIISRYGDNTDQTSSSEDEPEWSASDEKAFLRTLSALKGNDSEIYDDQTKFWQGDNETGRMKSTKNKDGKKKPMFLKDYERKLITEKKGLIDESDDDTEDLNKPNYFEQQEEIRKQLKRAIENVDTNSDDDLLVRKEKTIEETNREENDFYEWLKNQEEEDNLPGNTGLKNLKNAWNNPNLDEEEKFLRDYLINKDYEPTDKEEVSTFDDIAELEADERELDRQRNFELKYNFRFEDPDQEFIKQFPRTVKESLRQGDTRRKEKREEYKERKQREKEERKEELKKLKRMKKMEIEEKLEHLKKLAGEDIPISIDDLQCDFNPKEYDRRMQQLFNDEYYGKEEQVEENEGKPIFSYVEGIDDSDGDHSDYDNLPISTAQLDEDLEEGEIEGNSSTEGQIREKEVQCREKKESRRKRKRNNLFLNAVQKKKPLFDPKQKSFEEYFNEYYALDYEDIIGDQITRFKYREVLPNNFGLSIGEILNADDRQLNAWSSLKKATAYRSEQEEQYDVKAYQRKSWDSKKKEKIFNTDYGGIKSNKLGNKIRSGQAEAPPTNNEEQKKKKKGKVNLLKINGTNDNDITALTLNESNCEQDNNETLCGGEKKKRTRKRKSNALPKSENTSVLPISSEQKDDVSKSKKKKTLGKRESKVEKLLEINDDRLKAYGINPKKFKNKLKYGKKTESSQSQVD